MRLRYKTNLKDRQNHTQKKYVANLRFPMDIQVNKRTHSTAYLPSPLPTSLC